MVYRVVIAAAIVDLFNNVGKIRIERSLSHGIEIVAFIHLAPTVFVQDVCCADSGVEIIRSAVKVIAKQNKLHDFVYILKKFRLIIFDCNDARIFYLQITIADTVFIIFSYALPLLNFSSVSLKISGTSAVNVIVSPVFGCVKPREKKKKN